MIHPVVLTEAELLLSKRFSKKSSQLMKKGESLCFMLHTILQSVKSYILEFRTIMICLL